jgi:uncharacterized protein
MYLNLRSLQSASEHVENRYDVSLFPETGAEAFRVVSPVVLVFDIERQETGRYRVSGRLTGELELTCGRCLEPFNLAVATDFDLRYVPRVENTGEGEKQVQEDDLATAFYADEQIDLSELISEQFHLALPMKPLCSEPCKGLCPSCGTNLNTGSCDCSRKWDDPRLAALKNFVREQ